MGGTVYAIVMDGLTYRVIRQLGAGTFGTTYRVRQGVAGPEYAIKIVKDLDTPEKQNFFLAECVIQILCANASRGQPDGPFVPDVFGVALDAVRGIGFLRNQLMENTFANLASSASTVDNDLIVPDVLTQLAHNLKFLGTALAFSHRDLKDDNVMFITRGDGTRSFKLIDFGFSCVKLPNGSHLIGGNYFEDSPTCFKKDRDLSQLMFDVALYTPISPELKNRFARMLSANVKAPKKHVCKMTTLCPADALTQWVDVYRFLDRPNVSVPYGDPNSVIDQMRRHVAKEPFRTRKARVRRVPGEIPPVRIKTPKICPPGTVLNPATHRCVKEGGPVGRTLRGAAPPVKACGPGKERNPVTGRCVAACPPGKERSTVSGQCIKECPPGKVRVAGTRKCKGAAPP